jgi:hypothetical protein
MLAEWGRWDPALGQPAEVIDLLTAAYVRRQRFLARLQAGELAKVFTGEPKRSKRVPAGLLLNEMGVIL